MSSDALFGPDGTAPPPPPRVFPDPLSAPIGDLTWLSSPVGDVESAPRVMIPQPVAPQGQDPRLVQRAISAAFAEPGSRRRTAGRQPMTPSPAEMPMAYPVAPPMQGPMPGQYAARTIAPTPGLSQEKKGSSCFGCAMALLVLGLLAVGVLSSVINALVR